VIGFLPRPPMGGSFVRLRRLAGRGAAAQLRDASLVFRTLKKLFLGRWSLRSFSPGPIGLYWPAGVTAQEGLSSSLNSSLLSLQLGIINLFPIPPLDGATS